MSLLLILTNFFFGCTMSRKDIQKDYETVTSKIQEESVLLSSLQGIVVLDSQHKSMVYISLYI